MARWCILRTSGPHTLPLAKTLREGGSDVWTPARTVRRITRRGRRDQRQVEIEVPILPTIVFGRVRSDAELLAFVAAAAQAISPHPAFSVFRHGGRFPLISDAQVRGLQEEEERAAAAIAALRAAESRAEAEAIRIAALREESERRRAARNLERQRLNQLRAQGQRFAAGAEVTVMGMPALVSVTGIVEESDALAAWVRFGSQKWKIDTWRLAAVDDQAPRGIAA